MSTNKNNKTSPSFCYIAPTKYLEFAQASSTHLILAHLVDKDDEYAEFYKQRTDCSFIMIDNGAYELKVPYDPERLVELAKKSGAHAAVLPDYPFQPTEVTIKAAEQYIPVFKEAGLKTFFVPQSKTGDVDDWIEGYKWAAQHPDIDIIGMSILGIPNAMPHIDPAYARVVMAQKLIDLGVVNFDKHHHFLGLNSGPALEIPSLIKMGILDTVDSSGPIWAALLGHEYTTNADSFQSVCKIKTPVDFSMNSPLNADTKRRIEHNIELTQRLFNPEFSKGVWYAEE